MTLNKRMYEEFSERERLTLCLKAGARQDMPELDRLVMTSEDKRTISQPRVADMLDRLHIIALTYGTILREAAIWCQCANMELARFDWINDTNTTFASADVLTVREARSEWGKRAKSVQVAWDRFCQQIGYDPNEIATTFGVVPPPPVEVILSADDAPDENMVKQFQEAFTHYWPEDARR
jgi:hypothetical protein